MSTVLSILGSQEATPQGIKARWQAGSGQTLIYSWRGPTDAVTAIYNGLVNAALVDPTITVMDFNPGKGNAELIVQQASAGSVLGTVNSGGVTKVYEILPNEFMKRAEQAPYFSDLTPSNIVKAYSAYDAGVPDASVSPYSLTGKSLDLWKLIVQAGGNPEYFASGYVLRETFVISGLAKIAPVYTDVNKVVETPKEIWSINQAFGTIPAGEWLKKAPTVRQISRTKWHVQNEYWWADKWSTALYGGTGTP